MCLDSRLTRKKQAEEVAKLPKTITVYRTAIRAKIKREWITSIGEENGCKVYVTSKIIMPSPKDKKAIL
jgi:hypothetical protein